MIVNLKAVNMHSIINELLQQRGMVTVVFDNGEQVNNIPVRKLIFHMIFWAVGRKWGVTITKDFIVDTTSLDSGTISKLGTKILDATRRIHPVYHDIAFDFNDAINNLNLLVIDHCQEYHKTLSIVDLVNIAMIPQIKAITDDKVSDIGLPMVEAERRIKANIGKLYTQLKKPHPNNSLYDFINLRFVKDMQLAHIFYQIGFRTDIDDTIIRYPIQGNYLDGLKNSMEYCLEALSAKKAQFYSLDSIPNSEYFGRKQHILLSTIRYMYPGDCGTDITMPILITENMRDVVLYKNIVEGSQLISLSSWNIDKYIGKIVNFRTPMACRHTDGVCEACGGKLLASITPNTHIGMFSAIQTTAVVTQVILSAKHVTSTSTVEYTLSPELAKTFHKEKGSIYVKPQQAEKFKNISFVFSIEDAAQLLRLNDFNLSGSINEKSFGKCRDMVVLRGNSPVADQMSLESNGQAPLFSKFLIRYIADNPGIYDLRDNMFILNMSKFDFKHPVFKLIIINDSMVKFVNNAAILLETNIRKYTSATQLVNDFTNLVYGQVKPNIVYLEVVLRAALISNKYDYRLPIVKDIDNVMFTSNLKANKSRSVGSLCAFERLTEEFSNPSAYLVPKSYAQFDEFLCLKPHPKSSLNHK